MVLGAIFGCGNSSDEYVYTGASQGGGKVSGANQVLLSVTVPANVTGARPLGATQNPMAVKTVAVKTEAPPTGDYTLPGALCRAYDTLGQPVATVVVSPEGTVRFDTLPIGVYRFVVTNQDQAVLLETIASASASGPTLIDANTSSTAAVLVTLAAGKGNYDLKTYSHALAVDLSQLIGLVEMQVANPNDPWITPDGKIVVDPVVRQAVEDAVRALPGKGKYVRGDETPEGYGEATPAQGRNATGVPLGAANPTGAAPTSPDDTLPGNAPGQLTNPQYPQEVQSRNDAPEAPSPHQMDDLAGEHGATPAPVNETMDVEPTEGTAAPSSAQGLSQ